MTTFGKQTTTRRRGVGTLQLIVALPILVIVTVAAIQFGILMAVQQAVTHAATVAAREAGKGADIDELVEVVEAVLKPHCITIAPGSGASVILEDPTAIMAMEKRGDSPCDPPVAPLVAADAVRVTVCVELTTDPLLNALCFFGIDFTGKRFEISSLVKKE